MCRGISEAAKTSAASLLLEKNGPKDVFVELYLVRNGSKIITAQESYSALSSMPKALTTSVLLHKRPSSTRLHDGFTFGGETSCYCRFAIIIYVTYKRCDDENRLRSLQFAYSHNSQVANTQSRGITTHLTV